MDESPRKNVEIAALAREAMRANNQMGCFFVSPLPPGHAVTVSRIRALDMMQRGLGHSVKQKGLPSWHRNSITEADSKDRTLSSSHEGGNPDLVRPEKYPGIGERQALLACLYRA